VVVIPLHVVTADVEASVRGSGNRDGGGAILLYVQKQRTWG